MSRLWVGGIDDAGIAEISEDAKVSSHEQMCLYSPKVKAIGVFSRDSCERSGCRNYWRY